MPIAPSRWSYHWISICGQAACVGLLLVWVAGCAQLSSVGVDTDGGVRITPQQVSPSAWFVQGQSAGGSSTNQNFISNAGFIVTPAGVVVVDALGSPPLARQRLALIRRVTPLPIRYAVVTHGHADPIYGL